MDYLKNAAKTRVAGMLSCLPVVILFNLNCRGSDATALVGTGSASPSKSSIRAEQLKAWEATSRIGGGHNQAQLDAILATAQQDFAVATSDEERDLALNKAADAVAKIQQSSKQTDRLTKKN